MKLEVDIFKRLKEFNLRIHFIVEDECVGFMGSSGSGKSMTLKCIAGIETPDWGRIVYNDKVFYDSERKINLPPQDRHIGYLFQSYALFDNMDVYHNIECGLKAHKKNNIQQRIQDMMELFHISELSQRYPRQLSGGEKQRVALARVFAYEPDIILLDEPFSALDEDLKEDLKKELIRILKKYKKPVLFVSHNQEEVNQICQRQYKIRRGDLI